MLQQISFQELHKLYGKTIQGIDNAGTHLYIVFTDGTFLASGLDSGYDPGDESFDDNLLRLHYGPHYTDRPNLGDTEVCLRLGIYTQAEFDAVRDVEQQRQKAEMRRTQQQQLNRLYAELGPDALSQENKQKWADERKPEPGT